MMDISRFNVSVIAQRATPRVSLGACCCCSCTCTFGLTFNDSGGGDISSSSSNSASMSYEKTLSR